MFYNHKIQNAYDITGLQKQFNHEGVKKTVKEMLGYIVLAVNSYNTDWTIYIIKTIEDGENIVYVEDDDELFATTDYNEIFSHYGNQSNAEVFRDRFEKFLLYYGIINELPVYE
jgi:hypothetical protein